MDEIIDSIQVILGLIVFMIAGIALFIRGLKHLRLRRLIQNAPTSKIRSMAMGLVEIKGKAIFSKEKLISPISKKECVFYQYQLDELRHTNKNWTEISGNKSSSYFYIKDDTGKVLIDPANITANFKYDINAEGNVRLPEVVKTYLNENGYKVGLWGNSYRCKEIVIEEGDELYVLGETKKLPLTGETIISGEGCKFSYISDHSEEDLNKKILGEILFKIYGGAALTVACLIYLLFKLNVL